MTFFELPFFGKINTDNITDHLVVLWKDEEGTLTEIGMES